jgi:hypothetical protein
MNKHNMTHSLDVNKPADLQSWRGRRFASGLKLQNIDYSRLPMHTTAEEKARVLLAKQ